MSEINEHKCKNCGEPILPLWLEYYAKRHKRQEYMHAPNQKDTQGRPYYRGECSDAEPVVE